MEIKSKRHCRSMFHEGSPSNLFTLNIGEGQTGNVALEKLEFHCGLWVDNSPIYARILSFNLTQRFSADRRPKPSDSTSVSCHWSLKVHADIRLSNEVLFDFAGENQGVLTDDIWGYGDRNSSRFIHAIEFGQGSEIVGRYPLYSKNTGGQVMTIEAELEVVLKINDKPPTSSCSSCAVGLGGLLAQKREDAADITIKCSSGEVKAQKAVLTCCSPVFARMLASPMDESLTNQIKIDDFEAETIQDMITFMYGGTLRASSTHSIVALLDCAEKYDIPELKAFVVKLMLANITPGNATEFAAAAVKFGSDEGSQKDIFRYCKANFEKLNINQDFRQFFKENVDLFLNC